MRSPSASRILLAGLLLIVFIAGGNSTIVAQVDGNRGAPGCPSFELDGNHWSVDAIRRLEALGYTLALTPSRSMPACTVLRALTRVSGDLEPTDALAPVVLAWLRDFEREFPRLAQIDTGEGGVILIGASGAGGAMGRRGSGLPGRGEFPPERSGTEIAPDRMTAFAALDGSAQLIRGVTAVGAVGLDNGGAFLPRLEAVVGSGPVSLSVGRGLIGYGYARGGAVVLADVAPLNRVKLETLRPLVIPGIGSYLGGIHLTSFLGRIREERHPGDPYLWGAGGSIRPHPRFTVSVHRAAMFGGDEENHPVTGARVLNMLIGRVANIGFEDQVVALETIFHLPSESLIPLTLYMEWGAEDAAGAWWTVPGRIFGVYVPAVPAIPTASGGIEFTTFRGSNLKNPEWYRHWSFPGSWTLGDRPLGHPLGGHGQEWRGYFDVHQTRSGLRTEGALFRRQRSLENLFVPGREGASWGGDLRLRWRLPAGREIFGHIQSENGVDWQESGFTVGGRILLP